MGVCLRVVQSFQLRRIAASMPAGNWRLSSSKTAAFGAGVAGRAVGRALHAGQVPHRRVDLAVLALEPGGAGDAVLGRLFAHTLVGAGVGAAARPRAAAWWRRPAMRRCRSACPARPSCVARSGGQHARRIGHVAGGALLRDRREVHWQECRSGRRHGRIRPGPAPARWPTACDWFSGCDAMPRCEVASGSWLEAQQVGQHVGLLAGALHSRRSTSLQLRRNHLSTLAVLVKAAGVGRRCHRVDGLAGAGMFAGLGRRGAVAGRARPLAAVPAGEEHPAAPGLARVPACALKRSSCWAGVVSAACTAPCSCIRHARRPSQRAVGGMLGVAMQHRSAS
jgi:hypothetical protein